MSREKLTLDPSRTAFGSLLEPREPEPEEQTIEEERTTAQPLQHTSQVGTGRMVRTRSLAESDAVDAQAARKVARMKLGFYGSMFGLVVANGIFVALDYSNVTVAGGHWFVWPLALSGLAIVVKYMRAFVLRGRSLQGFIDSVLERMEEREIEKNL